MSPNAGSHEFGSWKESTQKSNAGQLHVVRTCNLMRWQQSLLVLHQLSWTCRCRGQVKCGSRVGQTELKLILQNKVWNIFYIEVTVFNITKCTHRTSVQQVFHRQVPYDDYLAPFSCITKATCPCCCFHSLNASSQFWRGKQNLIEHSPLGGATTPLVVPPPAFHKSRC